MRSLAVDRLRGLIIALMALDHASAMLIDRPRIGEFWGAAFPSYESALPFVVRALTHLCAPGFFLLMGVSMALSAAADARRGGGDGSELRRRLIKRGLLLVVVQHFIVNPGWLVGDIPASPVPGDGGDFFLYFGVLYGLGAAMVVVAPLLRASTALLLVLAAAAIASSSLMVPEATRGGESFSALLHLLWIPGQSGPMMVRYPLFPWVGVTLLGVILGRALSRDPTATRRLAAPLGAAAIVAFLGLRAADLGDAHRWAHGSWIDFFNLTKYPPSPDFLLWNLGLDLLLLALLARVPGERGPLVTFGQAALFFYVVHLYLYGLMGRAFDALLPGAGHGEMLAGWLVGLALMLPLCAAYGRFKRGRPPTSLWRFF